MRTLLMHHLAAKTKVNVEGIKSVIQFGQYGGNFEDSFEAALNIGIRGLGAAQMFEIVSIVVDNDLAPDELLNVVRVIGAHFLALHNLSCFSIDLL